MNPKKTAAASGAKQPRRRRGSTCRTLVVFINLKLSFIRNKTNLVQTRTPYLLAVNTLLGGHTDGLAANTKRKV